MARPPQGRLPGSELAPDDQRATELPLDLPRVEPRRRSRQLFGAPPDGRIEPRLNSASLSSEPLKSASDARPSDPVTPGTLSSIAGGEIARDPFAYYAVPRGQESSASRDATSTPQISPNTDETKTRPSRLFSPLGRSPRSRPGEPIANTLPDPEKPSAHVREDVPLAPPNAEATTDTVTAKPSAHDENVRAEDQQPTRETGLNPDQDQPISEPVKSEPPISDRLTADRRTSERAPSDRMESDRSPLEQPVFVPPGVELLGPERSEFDLAARTTRDLARPKMALDLPSVPADIRVKRTLPSLSAHPREADAGFPRYDVSERIDARFDSASDEAMTQFDPNVPPLVADRDHDRRFRRPHDDLALPNHMVDLNQDHATHALTSRMRQNAMADLPHPDLLHSEVSLDEARYAISSFRTNVDEVRVARAEARFKPKAPTVEELIAQSRVDQMEEEELFETFAVEPEQRKPIVPRFLKDGFTERFRVWKRAPVRVKPEAHRAQRRKKRSRLYEDIVAWIVVPPFIIGAIYGILEVSKFLANSPLGKMLSGQ